jgi:uncharacterized cupin superfamily protein
MRRFKLDAAQPEYDASDPEGYRAGMDRFGPKIGATQLGGSVYELPPGQSICPYHYEYPEEEWLLILDGRVVVRTPEGEEEMGPMELVCFPQGPSGAHKVTNREAETTRVLMLSTKPQVSVAVYPDSGKMLANTGNPDDKLMARRESAVDYYDGEA